MVWGVISTAGPGPLVRLHGTVNPAVYKELLQQHAVPYLRAETAQLSIFMQDNAPCHKAKSVTTFLLMRTAGKGLSGTCYVNLLN